CDVMLQPYPDGISTRRTSTITLLAHGCPVVTNSGALTESLWASGGAIVAAGPDPALIASAVVDLLYDDERREQLGRQALRLYNRAFHVRHLIAALQGTSGEPLPSAPEPLPTHH